MYKEGPDFRRIDSRIKLIRILRWQTVSSEEFLSVTPTAASHQKFARIRHKIRSVPDQIGVNAERALERTLDLFGCIIIRAETARRNFDELFDRGTFYKFRLPDFVPSF